MRKLSNLWIFGASLNWPFSSFDTTLLLDLWFAKIFQVHHGHFLSQCGISPFSMGPGYVSGKLYFSTKVWMLGMLIAPGLVTVSRLFIGQNQKYKK